jgi:hypothetical protein
MKYRVAQEPIKHCYQRVVIQKVHSMESVFLLVHMRLWHIHLSGTHVLPALPPGRENLMEILRAKSCTYVCTVRTYLTVKP